MFGIMMAAEDDEPVLWQAYVSWNQFAWLYLVGLFAGLRGALLYQAALPGWEVWGLGACALGALAVALRYWVRYEATSRRLVIKNAITERELQTMALEDVSGSTIRQGGIAWALGIGTIVFSSTRGEEVMHFRGVSDPESTLRHIQAVRRRRIFPTS
jgi:hypothetical protein